MWLLFVVLMTRLEMLHSQSGHFLASLHVSHKYECTAGSPCLNNVTAQPPPPAPVSLECRPCFDDTRHTVSRDSWLTPSALSKFWLMETSVWKQIYKHSELLNRLYILLPSVPASGESLPNSVNLTLIIMMMMMMMMMMMILIIVVVVMVLWF